MNRLESNIPNRLANQLENHIKEEAPSFYIQPPDGGLRAWTVLISAFICNGVIFGIINTYGVIYIKLQEQMKDSGEMEASSKAALVGSLTIGSTFFLSPVSGILVDKIGLRQTTVIGGIFCSCGMIISSYFTTNVQVMYFTYGIMFGMGAALAYTPSLAILGHYFKDYLGFASGLVTAGSSVFTVLLPNILDHNIKHFGLASTIRTMALMASFIILCGIVYKPIQAPATVPLRMKARSKTHTLLRSLINFDNWKKKRYVIWAFSIPVALFGYFVPYVHMSKFVEVNFKGESYNMPVMMIGVSSCIGRLVFGYIADFPRVNRIFLQQAAFVVIGLMTMLLPFTRSFEVLCTFSFAMGLFDGCFISLLGPIAYDICGQQGATQAIGFLLGLCSLPLTIGPPIAGYLFDQYNSYTLPFIFAGIPPLLGALCLVYIQNLNDDNRNFNTVEDTQQNMLQIGWHTDSDIPSDGKSFSPKSVKEILNTTNKPLIILASAESLSDTIDADKT